MADCDLVETMQHLFLSCSTFGSLWQDVLSWIGFFGADPQVIYDHFIQFIYASGRLNARSLFLQLIWFICVWIVWNERNNMLFNNTETSIPQLLDKVKFYFVAESKER